ncbi:MAG TPA: chaperone modulator CbpM [Candidatus Binataceae bacterium]|nr:chaperone modulator CbpM [Candidatus Binataceae bacterium]
MARRRIAGISRIHRRTARGGNVLLSRSVLCTIGGVSERQLAVWEREELLAPERVPQRGLRAEPLYGRDALHRIRVIRTLAEEFEVNLPGIGVILHLLDQLER